jgi:hypothetical protein
MWSSSGYFVRWCYLIEAMGSAIDTLTVHDARGFTEEALPSTAGIARRLDRHDGRSNDPNDLDEQRQ